MKNNRLDNDTPILVRPRISQCDGCVHVLPPPGYFYTCDPDTLDEIEELEIPYAPAVVYYEGELRPLDLDEDYEEQWLIDSAAPRRYVGVVISMSDSDRLSQ